METKANYVAVGAFVMACILGLVITLLWLAGAQYNQEFAYYQTYFTGAVTGLGKGTAVRYNGIEVGRVDNLQFDPSDPQRVIVTMQVQPNLNIREDSLASIDSVGLTGGSYVEISGGTAKSPLLVAKPGQPYPVIRAKISTLQELEQSAPQLLAKLNLAADRINDLLSDKNREQISGLLANLNETTGVLARRSGDIDATLRNFNAASAKLSPTVEAANTDLAKFGKLSEDADSLVNGPTFSHVGDLVADLRRLSVSLDKLSDELNHHPTQLLFGDRRKGYQPQ